MATIQITESGIAIRDLRIENRDIATYVGRFGETERAAALERAIQVGVYCLERAQSSQDLEFVRRQVEGLLASVHSAVSAIPGKLEKELSARLGTESGQVLAPVKTIVEQASKSTNERISEVRALLSNEIDPGRESSTIGRALTSLRSLLDPERTDSIQGALNAAIRGISGTDGTLAASVRAVVVASLEPLVTSVDSLGRELLKEHAAEEALAATTAKGATFEESVVGVLQAWAKASGAEIHHVGPDNQPGDVVVLLPGLASDGADGVRIVVEARDRQAPLGRKQIQDCITEAMHTRAAIAGVYISRTEDGLAREIGDWAEGQTERGPWVAAVAENLIVAIRYVVARVQLARMLTRTATPDLSSALESLHRISVSLDRVTNVKRKGTVVRTAVDEIDREVEAIRSEVRDSLRAIEETLRLHPGQRSINAA